MEVTGPEAWRVDVIAAKATKVTVALVVREDDDKVRLRSRFGSEKASSKESGE